jgi:Family of unknown function (DUF6232)
MQSIAKSLRTVTGSGGGTQSFGQIAVRERVLDTGERTIVIDNIATITLSNYDRRRTRILLWIIAAALALTALALLTQAAALETTIILLVAAAVLAVLAVRAKDVTTLSIATNDGAQSVLTSPDGEFLEQIKIALTEKINSKDKKTGGTYVVDDSHQTTRPDQRQTRPERPAAPNLRPQGERTSTQSTGPLDAEHKPGSPMDVAPTGSYPATKSTPAPSHIDYSSVLPNIEQWQRYAAQNKGWEHVAEKLQELETLLRSGTPTTELKEKARNLATELGGLLHAYPAATQLLQAVIRLMAS